MPRGPSLPSRPRRRRRSPCDPAHRAARRLEGLRAARELGPLLLLDRRELSRVSPSPSRSARGVDDADTLRDRSERELVVLRGAELADHGDAQRKLEVTGHLGGDDDTAPRDAEDDGVRAAPLRRAQQRALAPRAPDRRRWPRSHPTRGVRCWTRRRMPGMRTRRSGSMRMNERMCHGHHRSRTARTRSRHLRRRHARRVGRAPERCGRPSGTSSTRPCSPIRSGSSFFGVGEHHRPEFAVSSPEIVLAAAAGLTKQIHLGTAVTVLSSDDPVRVYERFATLDAVSHGRAEVILGRGSFTESFPLFGYDLRDYERALRGEARPVLAAAAREARHVVGLDPRAARERRCLPQDRARDQGVGRRRRHPGVRRPSGALRLRAHAGDHRRARPPLPHVRRPLPPLARLLRTRRRFRSESTRPATSPRPTSRRGTRRTRASSR